MSSIQYGCCNIKLHECVCEARTGTPRRRKEGCKPLRTCSRSWCLCEVKELLRTLSSLLASVASSGITGRDRKLVDKSPAWGCCGQGQGVVLAELS